MRGRAPALAALFAGLLASGAAAQAAVDGAVINRTTGKPQGGAVITLYALAGAGGMTPVKTVKTDAEGKFRIDETISGAHLLQTIYANVLYNEMLQPGAKTSGLELAVYDSSNKAASAKVSQHMVLLEPIDSILHVNESVVFQNSGNVTYNDPANGTLRIFVPDGARGEPRLTITAPQGMPVQRSAQETKTPGVRKIDFPVKPGETRFDITYVLPMPETHIFAGRILHDGGPVRIVAPRGVTLTGDAIAMIGQEPKTLATVYDVRSKEYSVHVEGVGQLGGDEGPSSGGGGRGIQTIAARIYEQVFAILGLALLILLLGFILLYRRGGSAGETPPEARRR
ncbi:MAG: hypothetical protein KIT09_18405 [Bryobacteraceae bacterium]|nr:hypothetical protein [Bryobacteraceae bacterium]